MKEQTRDPVIVVAANYRAAYLWCKENGLNPRDGRAVRIVLGVDRLRGMGGGRTIVAVNPGGHEWHYRTWAQVSAYLDVIRATFPDTNYTEAWT